MASGSGSEPPGDLAAVKNPDRSIYHPLHRFREEELAKAELKLSSPACLVLLNSKLYGMEKFVRKFWNEFSVIACADGGLNGLYDVMGDQQSLYIPHYVIGDLDSARPEVVDYYRNKGTIVKCFPDQDTNDFHKAVTFLLEQKSKGQIEFSSVYALNAMWGRFDQTMGNIGNLFQFQGETVIYLLSEDSLLLILNPGVSHIAVNSGFEEGHCGLIPIGEPCSSCSTEGLTWNLSSQKMEMKGLISTCNIIDPSVSRIAVNCTNTLMWTMSHKLNCF